MTLKKARKKKKKELLKIDCQKPFVVELKIKLEKFFSIRI